MKRFIDRVWLRVWSVSVSKPSPDETSFQKSLKMAEHFLVLTIFCGGLMLKRIHQYRCRSHRICQWYLMAVRSFLDPGPMVCGGVGDRLLLWTLEGLPFKARILVWVLAARCQPPDQAWPGLDMVAWRRPAGWPPPRAARPGRPAPKLVCASPQTRSRGRSPPLRSRSLCFACQTHSASVRSSRAWHAPRASLASLAGFESGQWVKW